MGLPTPRSMWIGPSGHRYPLVDSSVAVFATVLPEDVTCALDNEGQMNPCQCAIAQAFMRACGSPEVMIGRSKAYVVLKLNGSFYAYRFQVPATTRHAIDRFDHEAEMPDGVLQLNPPALSERLDAQRAEAKRLRERWASFGASTDHRPKARGPKLTTGYVGRSATTLATTMVVKRHESD